MSCNVVRVARPTRWRPRLSSSLPDERVPYRPNLYLRALFCMVARVLTVHFIYRTLRLHGYEDVTLHTINIQEQTILVDSTEFSLYLSPQSSRAPSWPSPPARYGLVLPANHYVVASPA